MELSMKDKVKDFLWLTLGTLMVTIGVYFFKFPNNFSTGGVSGISVILGALIPGMSTGTLVLIINVTLLIVGFCAKAQDSEDTHQPFSILPKTKGRKP